MLGTVREKNIARRQCMNNRHTVGNKEAGSSSNQRPPIKVITVGFISPTHPILAKIRKEFHQHLALKRKKK